MRITETDLFAATNQLVEKDILQNWKWLLKADYEVFKISTFGDLFLSNKKGEIFILQTDFANLKQIALNSQEFYNSCHKQGNLQDWFMIDLVSYMKQSNVALKSGHVFSYKKPPVLGGNYEPENFEQTLIEVHFSLLGQLHEKVKDLPDGTPIGEIKFN